MRMEEVWLIGSLAVMAPLLLVCAVGWWRASRRVRSLEGLALNPGTQEDATRRLEQVVEGLASQLDELASGQDFLQRVLTNKVAARSQPAAEPPKVTTPV